MQKENFPFIVQRPPIQSLGQLIEGWEWIVGQTVGSGMNAYQDIVSDLESGTGEYSLRIDLMRVRGIVNKVNNIRRGAWKIGQVMEKTNYHEDPKDPKFLLPNSYVHPIEDYYKDIENNDREAWAIAEAKGIQHLYEPLDPKDWPPSYLEYQAGVLQQLALNDEQNSKSYLQAARGFQQRADKIRRDDSRRKPIEINPILKSEVPEDKWMTDAEWNAMVGAITKIGI